jgi:hypothetical protein
MARRVDPPAITRLLEELKPLVESRGFVPLSEDSEWNGKFNICTWVRRRWKEDALRLGWRKPPAARYFLDAQWSVPRPGHGFLTAAGLNAGYARRGLRDASFPTQLPLIRELAEKKWCAAVVADAEFALAWLDRCSTLEGALAELRRPDRNGPKAATDAYAHIEQYVHAHADKG